MKKVLIATTNKDKYDAVSKIFKHTIFPSTEYSIEKLTRDMNIPDEKEIGSNIERAKAKALNAYNHLKEYDFDYIVGLDDSVFIKNKLEPNIKAFINKILFEKYLNDGEKYAFNRAYCIIDKNKNIYETNLNIPYIYHDLKDNFKLEENTYPLSKVSYPIGYNKPICELNEEEEINYYLKYVKEGLINLKIKNSDQ
ncbi:MAG: hypothetical protein II119_02180 [Bacilli bacterium]|nr:hypothetical protein [Bacilli bacterium]